MAGRSHLSHYSGLLWFQCRAPLPFSVFIYLCGGGSDDCSTCLCCSLLPPSKYQWVSYTENCVCHELHKA